MKMLLLKISNICLYVVTCALIGTGLLLELRLEERAGRVLGISKEEWSEFHFLVALAFIALALVHLAFHLRWIASLVRSRKPVALVAAAVVAIVIIGGLLMAPVAETGAGEQGGRPHHVDED